MPDEQPFTDLAEAIADGRSPDWGALEHANYARLDGDAIAALRDVAHVSDLFASLSRTLGPADRAPQLEAGTTWGGLRIVEHVGNGRYGDVYRAWDPALDRHVALKLVGCNAPAEVGAPVVDEGRLMARVRHPNVVAIYGAQRSGDVAGLSMEFVEGRTLEAELAARGPSTADDLARIGRDLAAALGAVHGAGLVHRDVKASNVLVESSGRVVLGDFGTGRELDVESAAVGLVGTPAYVAPEVFSGEPATPRSDIYSLGVLLFRLATGEYPQSAGTLRDLRDAHETVTPRSLRDARPDLPSALTAIVDRALDRDPARRFASGDEMARSFDDLRRPTTSRGRRALAGIAAALLLAVGWLAWQSRPAPFQFNERDWVLVADFDNRTDNPLFEDAVAYALALELGNSRVVKVVPRERVDDTLALMRLPLDTRVDPQTARELALRDGGIRAIVAGQIESAGHTYRLSASLRNPVDGGIVATVTERALRETDMLAATERLASKIRDRLRDELPSLRAEPAQQLPRVATRSLLALSLYQQGVRGAHRGANPQLAEELLTEAVREDPDFGVAHVALARAIYEQRLYGESSGSDEPFRSEEIDFHLAAAAEAAAVASAEDRYRIEAESALLESQRAPLGSPEKHALLRQALVAVQLLEQLQPGDASALRSIVAFGNPRQLPIVALTERLVSLNPHSASVLVMSAQQLRWAEEYEHATTYIERARPLLDLPSAEFPGDGVRVGGRQMLFHLVFSRGDIDDAKVLADELAVIWREAAPERAALIAEGTARKFLALGQLNLATEIASSMLRNDGARELTLSSVALSRQDQLQMAQFLDEHGIDSTWPTAVSHVRGFVLAGRAHDARETLERFRKSPNAGAQTVRLLEASVALAEGQPEQAVTLLQPVFDTNPSAPIANDLADALITLGKSGEAIRILEHSMAQPRVPFQSGSAHHWLALLDRLARLYREVGRIDDADGVDDRLRILLRYADDDHPIKRRLDVRR